jgi:hypothetical protein
MTYPAYLKERARWLRTEKKLTLDEIAERLALPKTTVWYWIRDLPLGRPRRASLGQRKGNRGMRASYKRKRDEAYAQGLTEWDGLVLVPTFRDFVVLYIAEGYKRNRNVVSICNSNPRIVVMAARWLRFLSGRDPIVRVTYHADQDVEELRRFWANAVATDPAAIRFHRKSNSGQLRTRVWRCEHGVASVDSYDTLLRARLQAWMDRIQQDWV